MKKLVGLALLLAGAWALIAPQANLGLPELRWIARYAFPGEAILGMLALGLAYLLLGSRPTVTHERRADGR